MSAPVDVLARIKTTGDLLVLLTGEPLCNHPIREVYEVVAELVRTDRLLHDALEKHWNSLPKEIWDAAIADARSLARVSPP